MGTEIGGALALPDSGPGFPYPSSNLVSGITGRVTKVTVTLSNITHTLPEEINVMVVDPNHQACVLMANFGGGFDVTNITMKFDSERPFPPYGSPLVSGTYSPNYFAPVPVFPPPAPPNYFQPLSFHQSQRRMAVVRF